MRTFTIALSLAIGLAWAQEDLVPDEDTFTEDPDDDFVNLTCADIAKSPADKCWFKSVTY